MALYGTMHQLKRMAVYENFCEKENAVLFATDIAARGLDFPAIDWVIQMDCPDDPNSYIHRAGRTARYEKGGESLLMLLPSEEAMVDQLTEKKIPIKKIEVNPSKLFTIQRKLEAMLARDVELKQMAQRFFVTYIKSVFLMKDKSVFNVNHIDMNALARSLGLAIAPRVRFLKNHMKATGKTEPDQTPAYVRPQESMLQPNYDNRWRKNAMETTFNFDANDAENAEEGSDNDEDIFKLKRKDHALPGEESEEEVMEEKKKKIKILTKEKVAKRILAKKLTANKIVNFDEEGNVCSYIIVKMIVIVSLLFLVSREFLMLLVRKFPSSVELSKLKPLQQLSAALIWKKPKRLWKKKINLINNCSVNVSKPGIVKKDLKLRMSVDF